MIKLCLHCSQSHPGENNILNIPAMNLTCTHERTVTYCKASNIPGRHGCHGCIPGIIQKMMLRQALNQVSPQIVRWWLWHALRNSIQIVQGLTKCTTPGELAQPLT